MPDGYSTKIYRKEGFRDFTLKPACTGAGLF